MAPRLPRHAAARIDQNDGRVGGRCTRRHVARILFVAGRIGDDETAPGRREEAIGDVDRDALLALRLQAVDKQRKVEFGAARAVAP